MNKKFELFFEDKDLSTEVIKNLSASDFSKLTKISKTLHSKADDPSLWQVLFQNNFPQEYELAKKLGIKFNYKLAYQFAKKYKLSSPDEFLLFFCVKNDDVVNFDKLQPEYGIHFSSGAGPMIFDELGSIRQFALVNNSQQILNYLFQHRHTKYDTPEQEFQDAVKYNQVDILRKLPSELKEKCINSKLRNIGVQDFIPELHYAIKYGKFELVQELFNITGIDINLTDRSKLSPLATAALYGQPKIIQFLVKNGADVNAKDGPDGSTILHLLFSGYGPDIDNTQTITLLLSLGASLNSINKSSKTPLELMLDMLEELPSNSYYKKFANIIKMLLKTLDHNLLKKEVFNQTTILGSVLISKGIFHTNIYSCMLLELAVSIKDKEIINWLVTNSDLLIKDIHSYETKKTFLPHIIYMATANHHHEIIELLIQNHLITTEEVNEMNESFGNFDSHSYIHNNHGL